MCVRVCMCVKRLVYRKYMYIGNHMNSSAIWDIIALSHVLEGRVITRGEASSHRKGMSEQRNLVYIYGNKILCSML